MQSSRVLQTDECNHRRVFGRKHVEGLACVVFPNEGDEVLASFSEGPKAAVESDNEPMHELPCTYLALVIVDTNADVKFSFWNGEQGTAIKSLLCGSGSSLRSDLATIVADLISHQRIDGVGSSVVLRDGGRTLRLSPLAGAEDGLSALVMEADRHDGTLARAASRYNLTPRQTEVLALVLEGASANDVARSLVISEYTAQGYVKSLLAKTDSRNRAAMVAKVLNWKKPASVRGVDVRARATI